MLFGEAAEACAVSQPALSMQIRELEDVLEVNLVEQRKSGVELTEQGEEIARRGRTILASVRDLLDYAKHRERVLSGSLKLGVIPSITPYLLPDALPAAAFPRTQPAAPRDHHRGLGARARKRRARSDPDRAADRGPRARDAASMRRQVRARIPRHKEPQELKRG